MLLLALIVLGPEKLPDAVRRFGKAYAEFKKMATGFQGELKSALDEPMRELRETADAVQEGRQLRLRCRRRRSTRHDGRGVEDPATAKPTDAATGAATEATATDATATESTATDRPQPNRPLPATNRHSRRPPRPDLSTPQHHEPKVAEAVEEPASE